MSTLRRCALPLLFAATLALLAWILTRSMPPVPDRPPGDDGYYLRYMQAVAAEGPAAFPRLFEAWNANKTDWLFPNPMRVGFISATALWAKLFGPTYRSLQAFSVVSFLLLCAVNYVFARRRLGEPRAFLAAALLAFSPLLMGLSRLALADSCTVLCMATTMWSFLEVLEDPASKGKKLLFMVALAATILVKEMAVLLALPLVLFVLYERFARRVPHDLPRIALCFAAPAVVVAGILLLAAGGPGTLWKTFTLALESPATNRYALRFGSGPWFRVAIDFLLLSAWPTLLGIAAFWVTVARLRSGPYERASAYLAFVIAGFVLALAFFTKNVRYAAVLDVPLRALAAGLVLELCRSSRAVRSALAAGACVALLAWIDWRSYHLIWVERQGYDPITRFLGSVRQLFP